MCVSLLCSLASGPIHRHYTPPAAQRRGPAVLSMARNVVDWWLVSAGPSALWLASRCASAKPNGGRW